MTKLTIKNTYHDAIFFATATINEKQPFHLMPSEVRLLNKLIHYSKDQENITWSSENISKHIFTSISAIDKIIQRLKEKGYINVSTTQKFQMVKSRTIFINWDYLEEISKMVDEYNVLQEKEQPKPIEQEQLNPIDEIANKTVINSTSISPDLKAQMKEKFDNEFKHNKNERNFTPAEFNNLTNNKFKEHFTMFEIMQVAKELPIRDFEKFWKKIQEMKNTAKEKNAVHN